MVIAKTKILAEISVEGYMMEQVNHFCYLGQTIIDDIRWKSEIRRRIGMAKMSFYEKNSSYYQRR